MRGYQAHESFWADLKMYAQLFKWALAIGLIFQVVIISVSYFSMYHRLTQIPLSGGTKMPQTAVTNYLMSYEKSLGQPPRLIQIEPVLRPIFKHQRSQIATTSDVYSWVLDTYTHGAFGREKQQFLKTVKYTSWWAYLLSVIYLLFFMTRSRKMEEEIFVRGTDLTPLYCLNELLKKEASQEGAYNLCIGETVIPYQMEPTHLSILGVSGSGKGVLINQLFHQMKQRQAQNQATLLKNPKARIKPKSEKIIVYDMKGEYVSKHFAPGDFIFSPFDTRGLRWTFFNEIRDYPDFDIVAKSLYNAPEPRDEYWYNCAKDIFRTGLVYLKTNGQTSNRDLWNFFSRPLEEIKQAFQTLPLGEQSAIKHIDRSDSNQSATLISILQERLQFFKYLMDIDGEFSFRDYVHSNSYGSLYLLNIENYKTIFKPLMTFVIDTLIREILSLPDDPDRRIFFIIDELGTLYRMESVLDLLTVGRSKGACLICSNQDLGRIEETYGKSNITTFYNNFNINVILRINEPKTADFLSQAIGDKQVIKRVESRQMSPNDIGDRRGISDQEKTERVVLATEFQNLKNFEAFIKIANYGISKMTIPQLFFIPKIPHFIMRQFEEFGVAAGNYAEEKGARGGAQHFGEVIEATMVVETIRESIVDAKDQEPEVQKETVIHPESAERKTDHEATLATDI